MIEVGRIIKAKRESIGMSQNKLARLAGIAQASLSALEAETKNPSVETIFMLASALNCSVSELLGESADNTILSQNQQKLLEIFDQLNQDGKDLLLSQAMFFLQQPKYRQAERTQSTA